MSTTEQLADEDADLTVMAEVEAQQCRWCGEVEPAATMQPMQVGDQQGPVCETCSRSLSEELDQRAADPVMPAGESQTELYSWESSLRDRVVGTRMEEILVAFADESFSLPIDIMTKVGGLALIAGMYIGQAHDLDPSTAPEEGLEPMVSMVTLFVWALLAGMVLMLFLGVCNLIRNRWRLEGAK